MPFARDRNRPNFSHSILKIERYGYFGNVFKILFLNRSFFSVTRNFQKEEFYLFGKKFFSRNLSSCFSQYSLLNILFSRLNEELIEQSSKIQTLTNNNSLSSTNRKRILLLTDHLAQVGGAETRICKTAGLLEQLNLVPIILAQHNSFAQSHKYTSLTLDLRDPHLPSILSRWIEKGKIHGIEIHVKNPRVIYDLPLFAWSKKITIGAVFHNVFPITDRLRQQLTHCHYLLSSQIKIVPNVVVVRNWTDNFPIVWKYRQQKTALLISRLSKDKSLHFSRFVDFCRTNNFKIRIASEHPEKPWQTGFIRSLNLSPEEFIGPISTLSYLENHSDEFLFVAGVGQIPLEASSLGFPVAVMSSKKKQSFPSL